MTSPSTTRAVTAALLAAVIAPGFLSRRVVSTCATLHGTAAALKALAPEAYPNWYSNGKRMPLEYRVEQRAARKVRNARKARRGYA